MKEENSDRLLPLLLDPPHQATSGGRGLGGRLPTEVVQDKQKLGPRV